MRPDGNLSLMRGPYDAAKDHIGAASAAMIKYTRGFVQLMGPVGFGIGLSTAFLFMFIIMVGMTGNGPNMSLILVLIIGASGGVFGFFLAGTVIVGLRAVLSAVRSRLGRLR